LDTSKMNPAVKVIATITINGISSLHFMLQLYTILDMSIKCYLKYSMEILAPIQYTILGVKYAKLVSEHHKRFVQNA
jgi:hypothetical protein